MKTRVFILTSLAMIAFASNSLLCRAALRETAIDPASFTFIRILSGALALWLIMTLQSLRSSHVANGSPARTHSSRNIGNWVSAFALFAYAAAFSFAYVDLSAGTGALLLFGAVQATMILWGVRNGEKLDALQILGILIALIGLVVLVFPGLSAPPLLGSILMITAGIAWGVYSLRGKTATDAIAATTGNFFRAWPFALVLSAVMIQQARRDWLGTIYALVSGAITSGIGYVIWYAALPDLKAASAATVQLSVPVLAATGGILLLGESINLRYAIASVAVLGGIALVIMERQRGPRCEPRGH